MQHVPASTSSRPIAIAISNLTVHSYYSDAYRARMVARWRLSPASSAQELGARKGPLFALSLCL